MVKGKVSAAAALYHDQICDEREKPFTLRQAKTKTVCNFVINVTNFLFKTPIWAHWFSGLNVHFRTYDSK